MQDRFTTTEALVLEKLIENAGLVSFTNWTDDQGDLIEAEGSDFWDNLQTKINQLTNY